MISGVKNIEKPCFMGQNVKYGYCLTVYVVWCHSKVTARRGQLYTASDRGSLLVFLIAARETEVRFSSGAIVFSLKKMLKIRVFEAF